MKEVYNFLLKDIKLNSKDIIVVGVSGGPDSMALLHILDDIRTKVKFKLICAHVNHNVRKASAKEKIFLEEYCKMHNIVFESMKIEKYGDDNFHNEARNIRYRYFEDLINKYNASYLMTAHHGDDLVETILMRITRGSTLKGYSGFSRIVDMDNYKIVRPLLSVTKQDIALYDKTNQIPYVTDKSNFKDKYTRNRYRKYVLPFLKGEDANVHLKFMKFSSTLSEYSDYIDDLVRKSINKVYKDNVLDINKYNELDELIKKKLIYSILEGIYQDDLILMNDRHIKLIQDLIKSRKSNSFVYLPNNIKIVKTYDKISINREIDDCSEYEIELIDYAYLPNGKHLELVDEVEGNSNSVCRLLSTDVSMPLHIRTRKLGDKMALKGTKGHKKLKDIFIDSKVPIHERDLWPVVVDSKDEVVWIPGLKKSKFDKSKTEKYDIIIKYY